MYTGCAWWLCSLCLLPPKRRGSAGNEKEGKIGIYTGVAIAVYIDVIGVARKASPDPSAASGNPMSPAQDRGVLRHEPPWFSVSQQATYATSVLPEDNAGLTSRAKAVAAGCLSALILHSVHYARAHRRAYKTAKRVKMFSCMLILFWNAGKDEDAGNTAPLLLYLFRRSSVSISTIGDVATVPDLKHRILGHRGTNGISIDAISYYFLNLKEESRESPVSRRLRETVDG
ncbi:hypothetical protein FB451DRAFT_1186801 [Mycena latifolia]|nr:hypothetical protein FB451DRAFT_1186801 [Mycena latifolia]